MSLLCFAILLPTLCFVWPGYFPWQSRQSTLYIIFDFMDFGTGYFVLVNRFPMLFSDLHPSDMSYSFIVLFILSDRPGMYGGNVTYFLCGSIVVISVVEFVHSVFRYFVHKFFWLAILLL